MTGMVRGMVAAVIGAMLVLAGHMPAAAADPLSPEDERRVTDYIAAEVDSLGVPGAAVVVVRGADVVFAKGFGVTGVGDERVTPRTPFPIASLSKMLTAMAVMQLVESGDLALTDELGDLMPALVPDGAGSASVSVENLLGHTSGWTFRDGLVNRVDPDLTARALERNAARIVATPLSHPIGEFEYSNANYDVLGYLIEQVSGEPYGEYLRGHVFEPLGMTRSFTSEAEAIDAGAAVGHYPFLGVVRPHPMVFVPGSVPSSFVSASVEDLGHLLIAHLNEGRYGDGRVLSPDGIATLQRPVTGSDPQDGYAMGLWVYPFWGPQRPVDDGSAGNEQPMPVWLESVGTSESSTSAVLFLPVEDLGVAVLLNMNDESVDSPYHQVHYGIANILLGGDPAPTVATEGVVDRNAKSIALAVLGMFILRMAASVVRLRRFRRSSPPPASRLGVGRRVVVPVIVDVLLVGAMWWFLVDRADLPLTLVRRSVPDIFLIAVTASVLCIGWALARTAFTLQTMSQTETASGDRHGLTS